MLSEKDLEQISRRGSKPEDIVNQIAYFRKGFPFLKTVKPATIGDGITKLQGEECERLKGVYEKRLSEGVVPLKFVPASGAASRMFQSLFSFQEACATNEQAEELLQGDQHKNVRQFFEQIQNFAFCSSVVEKLGILTDNRGKLKYLEILCAVLSPEGLNYGFFPKGLLLFHKYDTGPRTPTEEHMVEGALYGSDSEGTVRLHFTVSPEHLPYFQAKCNEVSGQFEKEYQVSYSITFSEQKPSTDTIAVNEENEPFRSADGTLVFRPGGHGALLENLNDLVADLIFVKNIDNVVPDRLKGETVNYKKAIAGLLLEQQERIFAYHQALDQQSLAVSDELLAEIAAYLRNELCTIPSPENHLSDKSELLTYLKSKLNRPIRVCGMVKNEGEPGGGPFWAINRDGTTTLQVVESSQIDFINPAQAAIAAGSSHFNPVDLVCGVRNYKGEKFNLPDFSDPETGFISFKSKDGKPLKAQELPGLWNGAMSDWITIFAEVSPITFNPVKTVNDLLRKEHQPV